jgi:hypothetical protein
LGRHDRVLCTGAPEVCTDFGDTDIVIVN